MQNSEAKLHVDEDWKTQVEREKEAAKAELEAAGSSAPSPTAANRQTADETSGEETVRQRAAESTGEEQPYGEPAGESTARVHRDYTLPSPSLSFLMTTLGTQAMVSLGQIPNPITGKFERQPQQAKHFIDTLAMLEEKTEGNRTPEESAILRSLLHQLRMAYVTGGTT